MKLSARWRLPQPSALLARQEIPTGIPSDDDGSAPFFVAGSLTTTVFVTTRRTVSTKKPTTVTVTTTTSKSTTTKVVDEATTTTSGEDTVTKTNSQTAETGAETDGALPTASDGAEQATSLPDAGDGSSDESNGSSLSGGAIAGIVIGVVLFLLLLLLAAFIFWRRRRQQTPTNTECPPSQGISDEKIVDDAPFPRWNGVATPLDSSGAAIAEVDGATAERGPSELPTSPVIRKPVPGLVPQGDPGVKATFSPTEGEEKMYVNSWASYREGSGR